MSRSVPDDADRPARTSRRRWLVYMGGAVALLVAGAGTCYALTDNGPRLSGHASGALGAPPSDERTPFVTEDVTLCLDRPGTVSITRVRPVRSEGGIAIQGFAVCPWVGGGYLAETGTLAAAGYHPAGPQQVAVACSAGLVELGIQIERTGSESARLEQIALDYVSDGYRHTLEMTAHTTLCTQHDHENSACPQP